MISTSITKTLSKNRYKKQSLAALSFMLAATAAQATATASQSETTAETKTQSTAVQWPYVNTGLKRDPELEKCWTRSWPV